MDIIRQSPNPAHSSSGQAPWGVSVAPGINMGRIVGGPNRSIQGSQFLGAAAPGDRQPSYNGNELTAVLNMQGSTPNQFPGFGMQGAQTASSHVGYSSGTPSVVQPSAGSAHNTMGMPTNEKVGHQWMTETPANLGRDNAVFSPAQLVFLFKPTAKVDFHFAAPKGATGMILGGQNPSAHAIKLINDAEQNPAFASFGNVDPNNTGDQMTLSVSNATPQIFQQYHIQSMNEWFSKESLADTELSDDEKDLFNIYNKEPQRILKDWMFGGVQEPSHEPGAMQYQIKTTIKGPAHVYDYGHTYERGQTWWLVWKKFNIDQFESASRGGKRDPSGKLLPEGVTYVIGTSTPPFNRLGSGTTKKYVWQAIVYSTSSAMGQILPEEILEYEEEVIVDDLVWTVDPQTQVGAMKPNPQKPTKTVTVRKRGVATEIGKVQHGPPNGAEDIKRKEEIMRLKMQAKYKIGEDAYSVMLEGSPNDGMHVPKKCYDHAHMRNHTKQLFLFVNPCANLY